MTSDIKEVLHEIENTFDIKTPKVEAGGRIITSLVAAGLLTFFPPSILRWDGTLHDPFQKVVITPRQEVALRPHAYLNRFLLIVSDIAALALASYGSVLAWKTNIKRDEEEFAPLLAETKQILLEERLSQLLEAKVPSSQPALKSAEAAPISDEVARVRAAIDQSIKEEMAAKGKKPDGTPLNPNAAPMEENTGTATVTAPAVQNATIPVPPTHPNPVVRAVTYAKDLANIADPLAEYRQIGENILNSLVATDKSILFPSGTGTGKTTTIQEVTRRLVLRYPTLTLYAITQKNDKIYGVEPENSQVFDPTLLREYIEDVQEPDPEQRRGIPLSNILFPLFEVYHIFDSRRRLPAEERQRLRETEPILLILDDWYSTYIQLDTLPKAAFDQIMSMIGQIVTVARDCGVRICFVTQTVNLASLGFADKGGASIRECLAVLSQGYIRIDPETGLEFGEKQTMWLAISNNSIVSKEHRPPIVESYNYLSENIARGLIKQPMIFLSSGSFPLIGLTPLLQTIPQPKLAVEKAITPEVVTEPPQPQVVNAQVIEEVVESSPTFMSPRTASVYEQFKADNPDHDPAQVYGLYKLSAAMMIDQILNMQNLNADKKAIIGSLWGAVPGGTKAWRIASAEYKKLLGLKT